jgi:hypothetical protein
VIIWGSRTKSEGRGFVIRPCPRCGTERVHFVGEARTKFTLYFIPTFTTSLKAIVVCTECETMTEVPGKAGDACISEALPQHLMLLELERRARLAAMGAPGSAGAAGGATIDPARAMALGAVVVAMNTAIADGAISDNEAAAVIHAIRTVGEATQSAPVREAAAIASTEFSTLIAYIVSPATEPVPVMLGRAGAAIRELPHPDRSRFVGQLAWLCHTVAAAGPGGPGDPLAAMDRDLAEMGFRPREIAEALAFCDASGG